MRFTSCSNEQTDAPKPGTVSWKTVEAFPACWLSESLHENLIRVRWDTYARCDITNTLRRLYTTFLWIQIDPIISGRYIGRKADGSRRAAANPFQLIWTSRWNDLRGKQRIRIFRIVAIKNGVRLVSNGRPNTHHRTVRQSDEDQRRPGDRHVHNYTSYCILRMSTLMPAFRE